MAKMNKTSIAVILILAGVLIAAIAFTTRGGFTVTGTQCGDVTVNGLNGQPLTSYEAFNEMVGQDFTTQELNDAGVFLKNGTLVQENSCPEVFTQ